MLSGVKTRQGAVGVNHNVPMMDCGAVAGNEVDSILDWSHEKGMTVGKSIRIIVKSRRNPLDHISMHSNSVIM